MFHAHLYFTCWTCFHAPISATGSACFHYALLFNWFACVFSRFLSLMFQVICCVYVLCISWSLLQLLRVAVNLHRRILSMCFFCPNSSCSVDEICLSLREMQLNCFSLHIIRRKTNLCMSRPTSVYSPPLWVFVFSMELFVLRRGGHHLQGRGYNHSLRLHIELKLV